MKDYTKIFERFSELPLLPRILLVGLSALLVGVLIWSASAGPLSHSSSAPKTTATTRPVALSVSPLLFGTNLSLLNSQDQVLTSPHTQSQLTQLHIQIIRIPVRSNLPETTEIHAAQVVKSLNAIPVVDLDGGLGSNALTEDTRIVNDMNSVFGHSTVYYEYGNDENLYDVSAQSYTASWNAVIPSLKKLAPQGQFVGPVTYDYDQNFLATFLKSAQPSPDLISWHEYTCTPADNPTTCLTNINSWGNHITGARAVSGATLGKTLPIMISEWNYAPEAVSTANTKTPTTLTDNDNFVESWTVQAFQVLAENHVFASMQYACDGATPLVDALGNLTTQGKIFASMYQNAMAQNQAAATATANASSPTQASADATATATSSGQPSADATDIPTPANAATATAIASSPDPGTTTSGSPSPTSPTAPGTTPTQTSTSAPAGTTPTSTPTPTPTPKPTPTPTPTPPGCTQDTWSSTLSPTSASGGSSRNVSGYCGGVVWLTLTQAPASGGHTVQVQICYALRTTNCTSWVTYAGVNVWLRMATGLPRGQVFYINSRCTACSGSPFKIYGAAKY